MNNLDEINALFVMFGTDLVAVESVYTRTEAPEGTWRYALHVLYLDDVRGVGRVVRRSPMPVYRFKTFEGLVLQAHRIIKDEQGFA